MLFLGGFNLVDGWAREITRHPVLVVMFFFGILALASDLISTPFSLYDTFVIEERFGFKKRRQQLICWTRRRGWDSVL